MAKYIVNQLIELIINNELNTANTIKTDRDFDIIFSPPAINNIDIEHNTINTLDKITQLFINKNPFVISHILLELNSPIIAKNVINSIHIDTLKADIFIQ